MKAAWDAEDGDMPTLSSIRLPKDAIDRFVNLGQACDASLRITVKEFRIPKDDDEPVYPLQTRKKGDHNATDFVKLRTDGSPYARDTEEYVGAIYQPLGCEAVIDMPVGVAADTLRENLSKGNRLA